MTKRILLAAISIIMCLTLFGCASENKYADVPNPIATVTMEDGSAMVIELYPAKAPNTVANFISLADSGFYDGMTFFRVLPGCLIQAGAKNSDGTGGPGYTIKGEFAKNGYKNDISHTRGVISMARLSGYDTAGSQFFILQGSYPEYDGQYAAFGKIIDDASLETLDSIGSVKVDIHNAPITPSKIASIRVDRKGYEYTPITFAEDEENAE